MKHSIKENRPRSSKGFSKGRDNDTLRTGPIMIEDIMMKEAPFEKNDVTIREMSIRTDPTDNTSPVIKRRFKPLDNPKTVLELLRGILVIKEGTAGNNVTTGPLQYQYWRGCLEGTALLKFNEFASDVGTETSAHLSEVEHRLVAFFAPRDVISQQHRYIRYHMRKPTGTTTRQYVGSVHALNQTLEKLPPAFNAGQKIPALDMMELLASKAPKSHKELMTDHGFDPQTATTAEFVEICERAETKESLRSKSKQHARFESDDDSSHDERHKKKKAKERKSNTARTRFFCTRHGPNNTHDSKDCKVLIAEAKENKPDWKKKNSDGVSKYKDYQSKYKKKAKELNLLQLETKKEKAKWTKAYKRLKSTSPKTQAKDGSAEEASEDSSHSREHEPRTFAPREHIQSSNSSDDSSSSSSSKTDSE
jgi:hypothetical protein